MTQFLGQGYNFEWVTANNCFFIKNYKVQFIGNGCLRKLIILYNIYLAVISNFAYSNFIAGNYLNVLGHIIGIGIIPYRGHIPLNIYIIIMY